jgi:glutathione S-transferase
VSSVCAPARYPAVAPWPWQVPLVHDKRSSTPAHAAWLRDTSSIIEHLEGSVAPSRRVIPACPVQAFFVHLLDDWADEFLWRPAMYFRWSPDLDAAALSLRFTHEFARDAPWLNPLPRGAKAAVLAARQRLYSVEGEDIVTPEQHAAVAGLYTDLLGAMEGALASSPFLLGSTPCLADFALMGPLLRHFASDPTPRKVMQQTAPGVWEYVARMWNVGATRDRPAAPQAAGTTPPGTLPPALAPLLALVRPYLAYSEANAAAWRAGQPSFVFPFRGVPSEVPVVPFRVWCRDVLAGRYAALEPASRAVVRELLATHGLLSPMFGEGPGLGLPRSMVAGGAPAPPPPPPSGVLTVDPDLGGVAPPLCRVPGHETLPARLAKVCAHIRAHARTPTPVPPTRTRVRCVPPPPPCPCAPQSHGGVGCVLGVPAPAPCPLGCMHACGRPLWGRPSGPCPSRSSSA